MKDKNGNEIFEFQGNKYNFMVGFDEESKLLKLTMIDIKTKQEKAINISGIIPQGATPDYILLNSKVEERLIEELTNCKLLSDRTGIFAKVNLGNMYKYDKNGVKEFLDYHTRKVEYEDRGKTQDEVKKDIKKYTDRLLQSKEVKNFLEDCNEETNTEDYIFMYSLLDKKNPQNSIIAYCNENADTVFLISPYEKGIDNKFEIVPEWQFYYYGGMMNFLDSNFEIINIGMDSHYSIWQEVYDRLLEPKDTRYSKGVEKYMKYCKKNKITKETIMKNFNLKHFTEDIMEFYKPKHRER